MSARAGAVLPMHCMHQVKLAVSPLLLVRHARVGTPPTMDPSHAQLMIRTLVAESQGKSGKELDDIFSTYYDKDCVLDHVALMVAGRDNIKKVFIVWGSIAYHKPNVDKILYDEKQNTAMVYTTQHLSPKIFPFLTFTFPLITILQFSGEHKLVITHHKDVWTYEGAFMTVPILGTFYLNVIRKYTGLVWLTMGTMLSKAS